MADDRLALLVRCCDDFEFFAQHCLKVRDKGGNLVPFILNRAQRRLHEAIERQISKRGYARVFVLKGRQQGVSTYVAARYYWKTALRNGVNTYILSHEQASSDALFSIVDRYQRNMPMLGEDLSLAPHVGVSNVKELVFDKLDSSYAVATAGAKAGGRGRSMTLFHGSEASRWPNAKDHFASSVQAVPLAPNTEIIIETTSAGPSGEYYSRYLDAEAGRGDYIAVFLPWYLTDEYAREPEPGFELSTEADEGQMSEAEYAETHGLTLAQMAWRRGKIIELGSVETFMQEYPTTAAEAWTDATGIDSFISPLAVLRARKPKHPVAPAGPLIIGVDPASGGGDRFAMAARRGGRVVWLDKRHKIDTLEGTAWCKSVIDEHQPARMNIDAGNIGAAIITNLKSLGPKYAAIVRGVNFGGTAECKVARPKVPGPANRRAEMWMRLRDWLLAPEGAQIADTDELQSDLVAPRQKPKLNGDFLLESKADMRTRQVPSTDLGDALALTFASSEYFEGYHQATGAASYGNIDTPQYHAVQHHEPIGGEVGWMQ